MLGLEATAITTLKGIITKKSYASNGEIKKPLLKKSLNVRKSLKHAEKRWLREYDDQDMIAVITQAPLMIFPVSEKLSARYMNILMIRLQFKFFVGS